MERSTITADDTEINELELWVGLQRTPETLAMALELGRDLGRTPRDNRLFSAVLAPKNADFPLWLEVDASVTEGEDSKLVFLVLSYAPPVEARREDAAMLAAAGHTLETVTERVNQICGQYPAFCLYTVDLLLRGEHRPKAAMAPLTLATGQLLRPTGASYEGPDGDPVPIGEENYLFKFKWSKAESGITCELNYGVRQSSVGTPWTTERTRCAGLLSVLI